MTHTLETTGIARVAARALGLNEDLTEAIGWTRHGHPPFGHAARRRSTACSPAFRHNEQSARIAGRLNLTHEVVDGSSRQPAAGAGDARGKVVRIVDRVAYINHDIDDAIRYGSLEERDCRGGDRDPRPDRRTAHRPLCTTSSRASAAPATSCRRGDRLGDALAARVHVRARLPQPKRGRSTIARSRRSCVSTSTS